MTHLGGHFGITNTCPATLAELQRRYGITSMLDVGCGPGGMAPIAEGLGIQWWGLDGDPACRGPRVLTHDYTTGPTPWPAPRVDLAWCVEVAEHIHPAHMPHWLETLRAGWVLLLTHALPGQGGHHHVNEQPPSYWRAVLSAAGWVEDDAATRWVQAHATDRYIKATGMVWLEGGRREAYARLRELRAAAEGVAP